jgi:ADP-heptose:LPS heptosyltransferase
MLRRKTVPVSVDSILIIKFFGMGSILLATPALRQLRVQFPNARIIFLTFSSNSEVLGELSFIDDRWFVDHRSLRSFIKSFSLLLIRVFSEKIDVVIDFEFFSKFSTLIGSLARPGRHIAFSLPTRWRLWNISDPVPLRTDCHISQTFLHALSPLGIETSDYVVPKIHPEHATASIREIEEEPVTAGIICINPNSGVTSLDRRWDGDRFTRVIEILQEENPAALFCLIGSVDEREYVDGIRSALTKNRNKTVNLAGRLTFRELVTLFAHSTLLITNDSGPMHAAAAVGLPTVALFGPESPGFYGPLGNRTINLYAALPCSPCLNVYDAKVFKCPIDKQCMKAISVEQVVEASRLLLRDRVRYDDFVEVLR